MLARAIGMNFVFRLFLAAAVVFSCSVLIVGCHKSSVDAISRNSNAKPVFGNSDSRTKQKKSGDINFDFVHPDHFACFGLDVQQIIARKEFEDVRWNSVESQLSDLVGKANSDLGSIERIWLLLDRETTAAAMEGKPGGLFTTVIQYQAAPNLEQLAQARANLENTLVDSSNGESQSESDSDSEEASKKPSQEPGDTQAKPIIYAIGDKQIVIGSKLAVEKMKAAQTPTENSELTGLLTQLDFSSDVEGVIATGPVRGTLKSVFGMAAQFGGEEARKFKALPDVLEQIEIRLSLEQGQADLLNIKAMIDDKKMIDQIVSASREAIEYSNANAKANENVLGEVLGGVRKSRKAEDSASAKIAEQVSQEIKEKNLLLVEGADDSVSFRLQKPTKISELLRAMVEDFNRDDDLKKEEKKKR